jgi:hypothetical protein
LETQLGGEPWKDGKQVAKIKTLLPEEKVATVARLLEMERKTVRKFRDMEMDRYAERRRKPSQAGI